MTDWPLLTDRLALRPVEARDKEAFLAWRSIPEVVRFMYQPPWTPEIAAARFAGWIGAPFTQPGENLVCAVVAREEGDAVVGEALLKWAPGEGQVEIGWAFHPSVRGRGYATEAARALLEAAFRDHGFHRVFARIDEENAPSRRVAERLGMRQEARLVENDRRPADGEWATEVVYAMLASEL